MAKPKAGTSYAKSLLYISLFAFAAIGVFLLINRNSSDELASSNSNQSQTNTVPSNTPVRGNDTDENKPSVPSSVQLTVPFTPQAPTANWDQLHDEACEEASIIMAYAYFNKIASLPPAVVEREITKLTEWQQENYGYYLSVTTAETARMAEEVYNLKTEIVSMDETAIKQALADNKLVILPANGQLLGNPNFTPPGPIYHMLVITGYNGSEFVTNDPGTRNGKNYKYSYDTLEQATGTWSHSAHAVDTASKRVIIVSN